MLMTARETFFAQQIVAIAEPMTFFKRTIAGHYSAAINSVLPRFQNNGIAGQDDGSSESGDPKRTIMR